VSAKVKSLEGFLMF